MNRLTRNLITSFLLLISPIAFADGFRCEGGGYHVKLYNHVIPAYGTSNPAKLILSQEDVGTLAVLDSAGSRIQKMTLADSVVYSGVTNSAFDGRFFAISFEVEKEPRSDGTYGGTLILTGDHAETQADLVCYRYLKRDPVTF